MSIEDAEKLSVEAHRVYWRITNQIVCLKKLLRDVEIICPPEQRGEELRVKHAMFSESIAKLKKQRKQAARMRTAARRALEAEKKKAPEKTLDVWGDLI